MPADLLKFPRCKAEQLGLPMPDSEHAVSACLPLWAHNIGYEEGDAAVIQQLQAAYPRFCLHPRVRQLIQQTLPEGSAGYIFPSAAAAQRALDYIQSRGARSGRLIPVTGQSACGVAMQPDELSVLKEYWQHAGEVVSSRAALQMLQDRPVSATQSAARTAVRERVAALQQAQPDDVWLYPSGMAAVAAAWRAVRQLQPQTPSVQFGFPYVDTLKIQQRFQPADCRFFPVGGPADIAALRNLLRETPISAVFCETPANPLLTCPDLVQLRELADQHGFLLVVDDTLAACVNLNVLPLADLVVTSLTKYFSGYGDVLAGSVTLNRHAAASSALRASLQQGFEELLADVDVDVLEQNSRDLSTRIATINRHAAELAARLQQHPAVDRVWHPSLLREPAYEQLRRPDGGYGGLLSLVLKRPAETTPAVFDALEVCKGPNLGTYFTLCCPYTILAHYTELDFVESCGVSRWLLRVSIGIEPVDELWQRFERALATAPVRPPV